MKLIKIKCVLLSIFLLSYLLCSCAGQEQPVLEDVWSISETGGNAWEITDTAYLNSDIYLSCYFAQNNSFIYLSCDSEEYYIHQIFFDGTADNQGTETVNLLEVPLIDRYSRLCPLKICPDGTEAETFWGLWKLFSDDGTDDCYALVKHNLSGSSTLTAILNNPQITDAVFNISSIAVLDHFCYLLTEEQLIITTTDGSLCTIEEPDSQSRTQFVIMNGKLYLAETSSDKKTVLHMLSNKGLSTDTLVIPLSGMMFYAGEDDKLYLSDSNTLFECNPASLTANNVLTWSDMGIRSDCLRTVLAASHDGISVLYYDGGYSVRTLRPSDTADDRTTITIMANQYNSNAIKFANGFNETNQQYKVKIADPGSEYSLYDEEFQAKIQLMLISDDCPDIIDLSLIPDWKSYAANDAFEDLTEFSASGSTVDTEDYLPNILKLGEASGEQIFFPYALHLNMLYGQEQYVGADLNWSFTDMLDLNDQYQDIPLFNMSSDQTLEYLIRMGMDMFVSPDGTCSFEQEMFYRILRISASSEYTPPEDNAYFQFYDEVADERALLGLAELTVPEFYLLYRTAVPLSSGDTITLSLKGIPSVDGQIGAWLSASGPCYAIASNSNNKEGAWQFIEYVLSCEPESIYLPARTAMLMNRLQNIRPGILGGGYEVEEWTDEYTESFYAIMENAYADQTDDIICEIILEEAQYYFNGTKTEQEAAQVIQNRVQLYLAE